MGAKMRSKGRVRGGRWWRRRSGVNSYSFSLLLFCHGKTLDHLSRPLRRGNGSMNLVVHMSAPRDLWHPLCTEIEEARQIFLTGRAGRAVKRSQ
jgi:hypothetical protein